MKINQKYITLGLALIVIGGLLVVLLINFFAQPEVEFDNITTDLKGIEEKNLLSQEGLLIKRQLIRPLGGKAGPVLETEDFTLSYLPAPDQFQVEIKTSEPELAENIKNNIIMWLKSRGLSEGDICGLPVIFNLSFDAQQEFIIKDIKFERLPSFCRELLGT